MTRTNLRILSNSQKLFATRLLLPAYNCSARMASTSSTYRLEAVASLEFLATENIPRLAVKLRVVDYSRQRISVSLLSQPSLNGSPANMHTSLT